MTGEPWLLIQMLCRGWGYKAGHQCKTMACVAPRRGFSFSSLSLGVFHCNSICRHLQILEYEHNPKSGSIFLLQCDTLDFDRADTEEYVLCHVLVLSESYWQVHLPNTVSLKSIVGLQKMSRGYIYISPGHTLCYHWTVKYIVDGNFKNS